MQIPSNNEGAKKIGRLLRVFSPFVILLAALVLVNLQISEATSRPVAAPTSATATAERPLQNQAVAPSSDSILQTPIATAIAYATESISTAATPTFTPVPTLLPAETVVLAGPPPGSQFSLSTPLAFYWQMERPLEDGNIFRLYLVGDDPEELVGELSEPNLGKGYQIHVIPEDLGLSAGDYYWEVRLIRQPDNLNLGISERRPLRLIHVAQ